MESELLSKFVTAYRRYRNIPLGGTKKSRYTYSNPTERICMSIGPEDTDPGIRVPFRKPLSTYKLGPPIISYGCCAISPDGKQTLMVQRQDTIEYIELVRGSYRESYLHSVILSLTTEERKRLLDYRDDFDSLWTDFCSRQPDSEDPGYIFAKSKFQSVSSYLDRLFEILPSIDPEGKSRWLWPKGRIEYRYSDGVLVPESPWDCAIREFSEEIHSVNLTVGLPNLISSAPIVESWYGTNNKNYSSHYFFLSVDPEELQLSPINYLSGPIRETSVGETYRVEWINCDELPSLTLPSRVKFFSQRPKDPQIGCKIDSVYLHPADNVEVHL